MGDKPQPIDSSILATKHPTGGRRGNQPPGRTTAPAPPEGAPGAATSGGGGGKQTLLLAAGAAAILLATGAFDTHRRIADGFDNIHRRIGDTNGRFQDVGRRIGDVDATVDRGRDEMNRRFDAMERLGERLEDDLRELRALVARQAEDGSPAAAPAAAEEAAPATEPGGATLAEPTVAAQVAPTIEPRDAPIPATPIDWRAIQISAPGHHQPAGAGRVGLEAGSPPPAPARREHAP